MTGIPVTPVAPRALTPVAPDVWQLPVAPMKLPGGLRMPLASTLVRLQDGLLLLYSPVPLDDAMTTAIAAEGEVAHIVAPNLWHHLYAKAALERFPRATLHGAPGLAAKRADLPIGRELGTPDPDWGDALDVAVIAGAPKLNEAVLFHRPSGTLVCADFVFNVTEPANVMTKVILSMMGVGGRRLAQSRAWKFAVRDRAAARASIDRVLGWSIRRVSPVHGESIDIDTSSFAPTVSRAYG
jgi:hypothetical protein